MSDSSSIMSIADFNITEMSADTISALSTHQKIITAEQTAANAMISLCENLKLMRDKHLYEALGFETFDTYTEQACGIKRRQAYNYISTYEKLGGTVLQSNAQLGIDYYGVGFFKVSEIMIAEKESIYLPNKVAEGVTEVANKVSALAKATQSALNKKYDSSNFESGTGTLAPTKDIYAGCEGSFVYAKNGNIVTVSVNITALPSGKNYIQMSGLPYAAKIESKLSSFAVYSTANKLINIRLDGSWIYVSSTDKFAEGEKINFIITYIIR